MGGRIARATIDTRGGATAHRAQGFPPGRFPVLPRAAHPESLEPGASGLAGPDNGAGAVPGWPADRAAAGRPPFGHGPPLSGKRATRGERLMPRSPRDWGDGYLVARRPARAGSGPACPLRSGSALPLGRCSPGFLTGCRNKPDFRQSRLAGLAAPSPRARPCATGRRTKPVFEAGQGGAMPSMKICRTAWHCASGLLARSGHRSGRISLRSQRHDRNDDRSDRQP